MRDNTMVIGTSKEKDKKETSTIKMDILVNTQNTIPNTIQEPTQEPIYENVWGNDYSITNKLEENLLADRRLYARALYMQKIECNTILESMESEPCLLSKIMAFMIIDISMGGIGIVCEHEIMVGTILVFKLSLDNISYDIKCEVVYCLQNDDKYRAGLRIVDRERHFIRHLKILVARLSLQRKYGVST